MKVQTKENFFGEESQNKHVVEENDNSTDDDVAKLFVFVVKLDFHLKRNIFSKLSYLRLNITKKLFVQSKSFEKTLVSFYKFSKFSRLILVPSNFIISNSGSSAAEICIIH